MKLTRAILTTIFSLALMFDLSAASRLQLKAREAELMGNYVSAISFYRQDMARQGRNDTSLRGTAQAHFALGNFELEKDTYALLVELDSTPANLLDYAIALMRNDMHEEAARMAKAAAGEEAFAQQANNIAAIADSAIKWKQEPSQYVVINLDINSCYSDWGAQLYGKNQMMFVSNRPMDNPDCSGEMPQVQTIAGGFTASGAESPTQVLMEWRDPRMMSDPLSERGMQIGPIVMVPNDNSTVYFSRASGRGKIVQTRVGREIIRVFHENLEIHSARHTEWGWEYGAPFEYNNPREYTVMHPAISPDGQRMYFVSDMPGGQGGLDIWVSEQLGGGRWGRPTNLGEPVNTPGDEVFPTVGADGTLYFSSTGHPGMGGLDIFSSKMVRNRWQPVQHLRPPFNSSADDFFFVTQGDSVGYFSSNRIGGKGGDDIYMFTRYPIRQKTIVIEELPLPSETIDTIRDTVVWQTVLVAQGEQSVDLRGRVIDAATGEPLPNAKICVTDNTKTSECKECGDDGLFNFTLKHDEGYVLSAFKQGYQTTIPLRLHALRELENEQKIIEMTAREQAEFLSAQDAIDRATAAGATRNRERALPREFRIQVLASVRGEPEIDHAHFDVLRATFPQFAQDWSYTRRDRLTRFTYGSFVRLPEARRYLRYFIDLGYDDSFIAVFEYGRQVESIFSGGSSVRVAPRDR